MDDDLEAAAAAAHTARREIDEAIADLAARPLDERAADRMRAVLATPRLRLARTALRRLTTAAPLGVRRPRLSVVSTAQSEASDEPERAMPGAEPSVAGGVA